MPIQRITPEADERVKRRALLAVFITIFVSLIGFGIVIPLLPFYAQRFQASELQIGLLFASFSVAQLFASPILGDWSDRWGRRPVLILSLLGSAASFVMLALAPNLFWLFVSRLLDGFTGGNITTARAYIADISPPERRARNFGLIGAAFGLGFILGPALGAGWRRSGWRFPRGRRRRSRCWQRRMRSSHYPKRRTLCLRSAPRRGARCLLRSRAAPLHACCG
jgi:multidrug resistance protein